MAGDHSIGNFAVDLGEWFQDHRDKVQTNIRRYFAGNNGDLFTGRHFETFAALGEPDRFEATDVMAVEALSVKVPPEAAARLLVGAEAEEFTHLLRQIPADRDIWQADHSALCDGSPAADLHAKLTKLPGVGWVTAGKLMAAKRPRLIPVLDNLVRDLLKPPKGRFWLSMYDQLADERRRRQIEEIVECAPAHVSFLRRIDVAVWMHAKQTGSPSVAK